MIWRMISQISFSTGLVGNFSGLLNSEVLCWRYSIFHLHIWFRFWGFLSSSLCTSAILQTERPAWRSRYAGSESDPRAGLADRSRVQEVPLQGLHQVSHFTTLQSVYHILGRGRDDLDDLSHPLPVSASTAVATGEARSTWWRVEWTSWSPPQDDSTTSRWTSSSVWTPSLTWLASFSWDVRPYTESIVELYCIVLLEGTGWGWPHAGHGLRTSDPEDHSGHPTWQTNCHDQVGEVPKD